MPLPPPVLETSPRPESRRSIRFEIAIVLAVTLGASAVRSLIRLIDRISRPEPLAQQSVSVLAPQAAAGTTDLLLQLTSIGVGLAWGALGVYLLWRAGFRLGPDVGLAWRWTDLARAAALALLIGVPGIFFYILAFRLGLNVNVQPSTLTGRWWTIPVQVLAAFENGFLEEVLVVGYLMTRLRQLAVDPWIAVLASALLRGSYHLYQGPGQALGNVLMGLVFGYLYLRWRRLWPLVGAHTLLDVGAFVGYPLVAAWLVDRLSGG